MRILLFNATITLHDIHWCNWALYIGLYFPQPSVMSPLSLQALFEIVLLTGTVGATMVSWYPISRTATLLMAPYLAWLCLATSLNYCIWRDNPEKKEQ